MQRPAVPFALVALLVALGVGCGREDGSPPAPPPESEAPKPAEATPGQLPPVEVVEGRVTLAGGAVPRAVLLEELAEKAGFRLELEEIDMIPLTLELREVSVEEALARILEGLPYGVHYAFDPLRERHAIALVRLGAAEAWTLAASQRQVAGESPPEPAAPEVSEGERLAVVWRALAELASQPDRNLDELGADPAARAEMAAEISPDGPGLEALVDLLAQDPDPGVRAAAAEQLGEGDGFMVVKHLLEALDDPDPAVVVAALEAVGLAGDETVVPEVEFLLVHPDPQVRRAAAEAIEFLE